MKKLDNFYEQLEATYKTGIYRILTIGYYLFGILAIFLMGIIPVFIMCLVISAACFFGKKKFYVEYEYAFTNGEIDIDRIVEMKKRKRVLTFNIKEVELLAQEDSYYIKDFTNMPSEEISFFPSTSERQVYVAMITGGNHRTMLRFVPDEEFLNLCFKYNPRAVKKV